MKSMENTATKGDLFDWQAMVQDFPPWRPAALPHEAWPPNYAGAYAWRRKVLQAVLQDPEAMTAMKAYYSIRAKEFIMHWMDTYDPRRADSKWIPFIFFNRQAELIDFFDSLQKDQESGLVEKCRDAGATWLSCAYSVHQFLFVKECSIGWGSRKELLVDKIGDPDSIFEKLRLLLRRIPSIFMPEGWNTKEHATYMKMINPENGATITGEAGSNIGRGGRKSIYFKDESAHYEQPLLIEAALGDNTNVQIDISSVNGVGNPFHNRRESGVEWSPSRIIPPGFVRVFIIDWRDHPAKTQDWYDTRRSKFEREGMLHVFAQEVERNYAASVENVLIQYDWIESAVDAHKRFKWRDPLGVIQTGIPDSMWINAPPIGGLDVADEGRDQNALAVRRWIVLCGLDEWGVRDTGVTTRRTVSSMRKYGKGTVYYDSIGIGAGVKTEYNRLIEDKIISAHELPFIPWNAGAAVVEPYFRIIPDDDESPTNFDFFHNLKAQAGWSLRTRFYKTFKNLTEGTLYPLDEMISIDSRLPLLQTLKKECAQPTYKPSNSLKTMIEKKPDGTKSPNTYDASVMAFFPIEDKAHAQIGSYGVTSKR